MRQIFSTTQNKIVLKLKKEQSTNMLRNENIIFLSANNFTITRISMKTAYVTHQMQKKNTVVNVTPGTLKIRARVLQKQEVITRY